MHARHYLTKWLQILSAISPQYRFCCPSSLATSRCVVMVSHVHFTGFSGSWIWKFPIALLHIPEGILRISDGKTYKYWRGIALVSSNDYSIFQWQPYLTRSRRCWFTRGWLLYNFSYPTFHAGLPGATEMLTLPFLNHQCERLWDLYEIRVLSHSP